MLNDLKRLLPDYEITHEGVLYDFKRTTKLGNVIHIPAILTRATTAYEAAKMIKDVWERQYA